jgi:hypothetical protein
MIDLEIRPQPSQLFFCFGPPKSGTTLLQRALNLHPQVSCPSEYDSRFLHEGLKWVFGEFNKVLQQVDRRTGGQGASLVGGESVNMIFRSAIETMMRDAAKGKTIIGANDNNIIANLEFFNELFDQPGLIAIFRNPIDQGLSAWHHNLRLAREENDPRHSQIVTQYGDLAGWLRQAAQQFKQNVARWHDFAAGRNNVHLVCYENLVADRRTVLQEIFTFLHADTDDGVLDRIVDETSIGRMRATSRNPQFFRSGRIDMGGDQVPRQVREEILDMVSESMEMIGYRAMSAA